MALDDATGAAGVRVEEGYLVNATVNAAQAQVQGRLAPSFNRCVAEHKLDGWIGGWGLCTFLDVEGVGSHLTYSLLSINPPQRTHHTASPPAAT